MQALNEMQRECWMQCQLPPSCSDAEALAQASWAGLTKQKVTKQLISSKKSRFITGAYFNYATSPQMNRDGKIPIRPSGRASGKKIIIFTDEKNDRTR
jgi:hypothetical protein